MPARAPLPRQASLARIVAQGLVPATRAPSAVEAVRRQLAIQGQQVSAVPHALVVRSPARGSDIDAAFASGELVRSWPMRGTVHITTAADHHWLRAALMHRMDSWTRNGEAAYGLDEAMCARAAQVALDLIAERGPLARADLLSAWQEAGLMEAFDGKDVSSYRRRHLLVRLQRDGVLVQGPRRGNEHLITDASPLPDADSGPAGAGVARGGPGHVAALAEIARRYATSHGPVSAADLARWTTLPAREAARALEDAVETTQVRPAENRAAPGNEWIPLARAVVEGSGRSARLRLLGPGAGSGKGGEGTGARRAEVLYLRADLLDLLAEHRAQARATHVLGSFDELHVGYKDRSCLTDAAGERLICPSANGMFRPLVVDRGALVGVRPVAEGLLWLKGSPSARLERDVARAVARVEQRLSR